MSTGAVIVGAAETAELGEVNLSALGLHADASLRALQDAGLTPAEVDGIACASPTPIEVAHHLGIWPRWMDGTMVGGCSPLLHVRHAAAALDQGQCEVVLVTHGQSGRSGFGPPPVVPAGSAKDQFEHTFGATAPYSNFTVPARRFLSDRGMSREHLAAVVVAQRRWATDTPRALRRTPVTIDEVLSGPMVADPFTRDMCCPLTDGGGALVMMSAKRASRHYRSQDTIHLLGAAEALESALVSQMKNPSYFSAWERASVEALGQARVTHDLVDHLMIYDAYAHVPLYGLEALGFVAFGESGDFVMHGHTSPGGRLPVNTNGGGLSYTHTGMYGMFAITEAVRQLRREASAQVPDAAISMVAGVGQMFGVGSCLVLAREPV